jgi:hypothetical protein
MWLYRNKTIPLIQTEFVIGVKSDIGVVGDTNYPYLAIKYNYLAIIIVTCLIIR